MAQFSNQHPVGHTSLHACGLPQARGPAPVPPIGPQSSAWCSCAFRAPFLVLPQAREPAPAPPTRPQSSVRCSHMFCSLFLVCILVLKQASSLSLCNHISEPSFSTSLLIPSLHCHPVPRCFLLVHVSVRVCVQGACSCSMHQCTHSNLGLWSGSRSFTRPNPRSCSRSCSELDLHAQSCQPNKTPDVNATAELNTNRLFSELSLWHRHTFFITIFTRCLLLKLAFCATVFSFRFLCLLWFLILCADNQRCSVIRSLRILFFNSHPSFFFHC